MSSSSAAGHGASQTAQDALPPLSFAVAATDDDRRDALCLVADSIAQQRQTASLAVISHPVCLAALALACSLAWRHNARDYGTALTAVSGLAIAYLAAVRLFTSRYVALAEDFKWRAFIAAPDGREDLVVAARFGTELIGTLVLRLQPPDARQHQQSLAGGRGLIRAWTTKLRFRNKGIGADLLRFAVVATRSACGDAAEVAFDPHHANSALPLNHMFNRPFRIRDAKAARALAHALRDCENGEGSFE
ncbi:Acetyltransferase, GNAT family [Tolypocladium paradoxum]|uniref:Acetyltransferase, GNAT family n=1 Tax=Tolypocladium paradoxum TaxID=94208 RepID=A0A2S4KN81_9HYPO|nr:Acetyltransferase, GNAT family [Tolypocladium paradoxum]